MKKRYVFGFLLVALMAAVGCKKQGNKANLNGYWVGKWGFSSAAPTENLAVIFRDNGTIRVLYSYVTDTATAGFKLEGTYTQSDNEVRFSYVESGSTFIHVSSPSSVRLEGTWGTSPSTTNGGSYFLDKK